MSRRTSAVDLGSIGKTEVAVVRNAVRRIERELDVIEAIAGTGAANGIAAAVAADRNKGSVKADNALP